MPDLPLVIIEDPDELGWFAVPAATPVSDEVSAFWAQQLHRRTWLRLHGAARPV